MELTFDELLRYSQEERDKWRAWFGIHPDALAIEVQPVGRHPTVGALIDHIVLVERRHLQRLTDAPLSSNTGLSGRHAPPLFDYGASVRRELEQYVSDLDDNIANEPTTFTMQSGGDVVLTPRKLLFHILLHETRHWAQIALAIRRAGLEPPGNHDLLYSRALK